MIVSSMLDVGVGGEHMVVPPARFFETNTSKKIPKYRNIDSFS